jgi:predicted metalloprotease
VPRGAAIPSCGGPTTASPFYCGSTRTIVLPAVFFERLWQNDADAAVAVVIAHEWGHHVQRSLGMFSGDYFSIQTELQADCLAGVFFQHAAERGWLDAGDLDEALAISWRGGDSVLVAWFDEGAHGTPRQRVDAFSRGFQGTRSCSVYTS